MSYHKAKIILNCFLKHYSPQISIQLRLGACSFCEPHYHMENAEAFSSTSRLHHLELSLRRWRERDSDHQIHPLIYTLSSINSTFWFLALVHPHCLILVCVTFCLLFIHSCLPITSALLKVHYNLQCTTARYTNMTANGPVLNPNICAKFAFSSCLQCMHIQYSTAGTGRWN